MNKKKKAIGPKGKICFTTPLEKTKEIYYCVTIKEIILRNWWQECGKCCGPQEQGTHLEVREKDIRQNVYFKKVMLGVIYSKNYENEKGKW